MYHIHFTPPYVEKTGVEGDTADCYFVHTFVRWYSSS